MTDDDLKAMFAVLRQESAAAHAETQRRFEETNRRFEETQRLFAETADRIAVDNQHFFATGAERLRHEIQLVAEGVTDTRKVLNREVASVREEVVRTASETQAMIRFSHAELDRRVRALEDSHRTVEQTLADLQARLDRLEGSTH
jgi:hypothetical protein